MEQVNDTADILEVTRAYHAAMVDARTDQLDELLDPAYSLVHITGYVQPKDEWFDVIRSKQFDYHTIDIDNMSASVTGNTAIVTGKGVFNATINGMQAPWRLQFRLAVAKQGGRWKIMSARYTGF